jgi:hypothetical protein
VGGLVDLWVVQAIGVNTFHTNDGAKVTTFGQKRWIGWIRANEDVEAHDRVEGTGLQVVLGELIRYVRRPPLAFASDGGIMWNRSAMSVEQAILEAVRALPADKQQEILSHATRLREEIAPKQPFKSIKGLWADLGISLPAEEIEENQREMWKNFPREDI